MNGDDAEVFGAQRTILVCNLYAYCENNPVNNKDINGQILQSVLFKIFAGVICGILIQLFEDLLDYFIQVIVKGRANARFQVCIGDYLASVLEQTLNFMNPFKNAKVIGQAIKAFLPFGVKYGYKFAKGSKIDAISFWTDLIFATLSFVVDLALGAAAKKKIKQVQQKSRNRKSLHTSKLVIRKEFRVLGQKLGFYINLTQNIVNVFFMWIKAYH